MQASWCIALFRHHIFLFVFVLTLAPAHVAWGMTVNDPTGVSDTTVDPTGSEETDNEVGNVSLADFNDDPRKYTLDFEDGAYTLYQALDRVSFSATSEVGQPIDIDFIATNANWFQIRSSVGQSSSGSKSLSLRQLEMPGTGDDRFTYITFSQAMQKVGFVLSNIHAGDTVIVKFYNNATGDDLAGTNELASYTFSGGSNGSDGDEIFVGYENTEGIARVQIILNVVGSPNGPADYRAIDDLSFVPGMDKIAQRANGQQFINLINGIANGDTLTIPPGDYRFTSTQQPVLMYGHSNVTIIADDVRLWFEDANKGGFRMDTCSNVSISGWTIAYDPLPFTQGIITALDDNTDTIQFQVDWGYPLPDAAWTTAISQNAGAFKAIFYDAAGDHLLDARLDWVNSLTDQGNRTYEVGFLNGFVFTQPSGSNAVQVGDKFVLPWRRHMPAMENVRSDNITIDGVTIHSSPAMGFVEGNGYGNNTYTNCQIVRPPNSDQLLTCNADGFHSFMLQRGPLVEDCEFAYVGDDLIAVHTFFGVVIDQPTETQLVIAAVFDNDFTAGSQLRLHSIEDAATVGRAMVDEVTETTDPSYVDIAADLHNVVKAATTHSIRSLVYDKVYIVDLTHALAVSVPLYSLVESGNRRCAGTVIRNNDLHDGRVRGIAVRSHDALIEGNTLSHTGMGAITVVPDRYFLENTFARRITIRNNTITDCNLNVMNDHYVFSPHIGTITIGADFGPSFSPYALHEDITISGNTITRPPAMGIFASNVSHLTISNNTIHQPMFKLDALSGNGPRFDVDGGIWIYTPRNAISIMASEDAMVESNTVTSPPGSMTQTVGLGPYVETDSIYILP